MNPSSFVEMLERADLVIVGGNPAGYQTSEPTGEPENQIARFTWHAGKHQRTTILTEQGVENLTDLGCGFLCEDHEGDRVVVDIYQRVNPIEQDKTPFSMKRIERVAKIQKWISQRLTVSMVPALFITLGLMEERQYQVLIDSPVSDGVIYQMIAPWLKEIGPDQPEHKIAIFLENAIHDGEILPEDYASLADTYGTMSPHEFLRTHAPKHGERK